MSSLATAASQHGRPDPARSGGVRLQPGVLRTDGEARRPFGVRRGDRVGWVERGQDGGGRGAAYGGYLLGDPATQWAVLHATPELAAHSVHRARTWTRPPAGTGARDLPRPPPSPRQDRWARGAARRAHSAAGYGGTGTGHHPGHGARQDGTIPASAGPTPAPAAAASIRGRFPRAWRRLPVRGALLRQTSSQSAQYRVSLVIVSPMSITTAVIAMRAAWRRFRVPIR